MPTTSWPFSQAMRATTWQPHFSTSGDHAHPQAGSQTGWLPLLVLFCVINIRCGLPDSKRYPAPPLLPPACRALAAAIPFSVARENLVTHFEQNRAACAKLGAAAGAGGPMPRGQRPASQATKELRTRWVNGGLGQ